MKNEMRAKRKSEKAFMNFMPMLPLLKAMTLHDESYISWCFSSFPNIHLVSQVFPRVSTLATLLISNEPCYHNYCYYQIFSFTSLFECHSYTPFVSIQNDEIVESPNMVLKRYLADFEEEFANSSFEDFPQPLFSSSQISLNQNIISSFEEISLTTSLSHHSPIVGSQHPMIHDSIAVAHTPIPTTINTSFPSLSIPSELNLPNVSNSLSSSHIIAPQLQEIVYVAVGHHSEFEHVRFSFDGMPIGLYTPNQTLFQSLEE